MDSAGPSVTSFFFFLFFFTALQRRRPLAERRPSPLPLPPPLFRPAFRILIASLVGGGRLHVAWVIAAFSWEERAGAD